MATTITSLHSRPEGSSLFQSGDEREVGELIEPFFGVQEAVQLSLLPQHPLSLRARQRMPARVHAGSSVCGISISPASPLFSTAIDLRRQIPPNRISRERCRSHCRGEPCALSRHVGIISGFGTRATIAPVPFPPHAH